MKNPKFFTNLFLFIIDRENHFFLKLINFIILFFMIFFIIVFQQINTKLFFKIGEKPKRDIIANEDIEFINEDLSKKMKNRIIETTPPIYVYNYEILKIRENQINKLFDKISSSSNYEDIKNNLEELEINLSPNEYQLLKKIDQNSKNFIIKIFLDSYSNSGIVQLDSSQVSKLESSGIKIRKEKNEIHYSTESIDNTQSVNQKLINKIDLLFRNLNDFQKKLILNVLNEFIIPNVFYNKEISETMLKNKLDAESSIITKIQKGTKVALKGQPIKKDDIEKIKAVLKKQKDFYNINNIISLSILLIFILSFLYYFINYFEKNNFKDFKNYIFVSATLLVIILYFSLLLYLGIADKSSIYYGLYIPISAISISYLFLYSKYFAGSFSILISILFFYISGYNNYAFLFIFCSGLLPIFLISNLKGRINLIIAGLKVSMINIIVSIFIYFSLQNDDIEILNIILYSASNGILSSLLSIGIILLGEYFLNTPTIFKLQELTHFSNPLLKTLFNSAIGTYNHSIIVGNLAEAAALEIGANELLSKVGGYYHDIGKLDNPEYFIENQGNYNKHEQLKPSISTSIIKSHVKSGIIRGKKSKLPQKVIDIISQHHGNALIKYFYEEAVKSNSPDKEEIQKTDFHYQYENPDFPEAAIVLLADQVEAATRSLKKYTMKTIDKTIEKIVDDNFQNGILDDSGLTLKDITKIKKIFCKIITGMYHPRIEYPTSTLIDDNIKNKQKIIR